MVEEGGADFDRDACPGLERMREQHQLAFGIERRPLRVMGLGERIHS